MFIILLRTLCDVVFKMITNFVFLLCVMCVCQSAYIDTLNKCNLRDEECCKKNLEQLIKELSKKGLPEYDIPPLDPFHIKDLSLPILNVLDLTVLDGIVKGFKTCVVNKHYTNIETSTGHIDLTCVITAKGRYKAHSSSEIVKSLFGGNSIHGEGNGKVRIDKLHIKFDYNFVLEKRNGEIYIIDKADKVNYKYEILGKMVFAADNLYLGDVESSKLITDFLNQNWKDLFGTFGGEIMDRAMEIVHSYLKNFYYNVPIRYFILDDLEHFVSK